MFPYLYFNQYSDSKWVEIKHVPNLKKKKKKKENK